jgi:hypothetical protein
MTLLLTNWTSADDKVAQFFESGLRSPDLPKKQSKVNPYAAQTLLPAIFIETVMRVDYEEAD